MTEYDENALIDLIPGCDETDFLELPREIIARILRSSILDERDLLTFGQVCKSLHDVANSEDLVWAPKCEARWGSRTSLSSWLCTLQEAQSPVPTPPSTPPRFGSAPLLGAATHDSDLHANPGPSTYLDLYRLLSKYETLVGVWRAVGKHPRGGLYSFAWHRDAIVGSQHMGHTPSRHLRAQEMAVVRARPADESLSCVPQFIDAEHIGLVRAGEMHACSSSPAGLNSRAEAAATVGATLHTSRSLPRGARTPLASISCSPPQSFGNAYFEFTSGRVAEPGGRRRQRRATRAGRGAEDAGIPSTSRPPPQVSCVSAQHFARLHVPVATELTPLAGLWSAVYMSHELEIVLVEYGVDGTIIATKVTGDECVPAGEKTWTACTATLRTSLTSEEGSILMESEQEADMQDFESDRELELENVTPPRYIYDPFNSPEHLNNRGPVVRCYDGKGLIASEGYTSPTWVDGCLW
eukprot:CAMPEP_0114282094 /NCGR_PEP_ID=MMETSP0059-20121206/3372_1 /TAXON_ID=36894 /ORGANISM="Pyramimonas parkeae, Strain CCMP726" /LENGTH=466 /DNA_ID=CAMNT_0001402707 /DNA_START=8 /DNA_END=1405 /DNA_ORIENTATION=+